MKRINAKLGLFLLCLLVMQLVAHGQESTVKPLNIGDKVPDIELTLHTGDSVSKVHLSDFKGKVIIFDTWDTGCGVCIESMPHMLQLQQQFKDRVKIIMVADNTEQQVKARFFNPQNGLSTFSPKLFDAAKHLTWLYDLHMQSHYQNYAVNSLFYHVGNPMHIWIDGNGIYKAMTDGYSTSAATIEMFLKGNNSKMKSMVVVKNPFIILDLPNFKNQLKAYSIITGNIQGNIINDNIIERDSISQKVIALNFANKSAIDLYRTVFENKFKVSYPGWLKGYIPPERILVEVSDRSKFIVPNGELGNNDERNQWYKINTYCYALKVPVSGSANIYDNMEQDLDRFFNIESTNETLKVKCLVLKRITEDDKLKSKIGILAFVNKNSDEQSVFQNRDFNDVFQFLQYSIRDCHPIGFNYLTAAPILLDETGYTGKVDMELPNWKYGITLGEIRKALQKYGLDLVEAYRDRQMFVLQEKGYQSITKSN